LGATACTTPSTHSSPAQPVGLLGVDWILDDASLATQVAKVPGEIPIDLRFEGEQVSGSSGCNTYGGSYDAGDGSLSFGQMQMTLMACEDGLMQLESAYLDALGATTAFQISDSGLLLTGGKVALSFTTG